MPDLGTIEIALLALLAALALGPAGGFALLRDMIAGRRGDSATGPPPGATAPPVPRFCAECGTRLQPGARFCAECGTRIQGLNARM